MNSLENKVGVKAGFYTRSLRTLLMSFCLRITFEQMKRQSTAVCCGVQAVARHRIPMC